MSDLDLADIEAVNGYIDKLENEIAEAKAVIMIQALIIGDLEQGSEGGK